MSEHAPGRAQRMPGSPPTESGLDMPLASWYRITPAIGAIEYVVITDRGVYRADPLGQIHDFFACLYECAAVDTPADALHHVGSGYEMAVA